MKFVNRTIIVLFALNLTTGTLALAREQSDEEFLTISGSATLPNVKMMGLPGNPVTDDDGSYSVTVPRGWGGKVMPAKEGYRFSPSIKRYPALYGDVTSQDYVPSTITFTISGTTGIGEVMMQGLPGNVYSDQRGYYSVELGYGWSGVVRPVKGGHSFVPPARLYQKVSSDQANQDYVVESASANAEGSDLYGIGTSRSQGRRRGSASSVDMMYDPVASRSGGRTARSGPTIGSVGRKALVIPAGQIKAKELAETVEDMRVMSHILDERFKQTRRIQGMFTDFGAFFGQDSRNTEATYLQGFGVLFLMEVNFAFSPPPKPQAKDPSETAEAVDSTWQKARQQVLSPGASSGMDLEDSARDYDNQMVEELKKELVQALKHASNIRHIGPDEWVILTVIGGQRQFSMGAGMSEFGGSARRSGGSSGGMMGGAGGYGGGGGFVVGGYGSMGGMMGSGMGGMYGGMATYSGRTFSSSTVLTIRAKRANVDDFAKGQLDLEQFQEHVQIFMY
jgi:hypothetical protein